MDANKKKIIIISGVTGAIGTALFAEYGQDRNNVVYGISRKALPVEAFLKGGLLPHQTLICSIGDAADYSTLFAHIDYDVSEVVYVHALGLYPFEVDTSGNIVIENDVDKDGVNDEVTKLSFTAFVSATQNLEKYWQGKTTCLIFGSIADRHQPAVHQSWWKTIEKVKQYMRGRAVANANLSMIVFDISSVLCPHEVITRPFVFTNTDADQAYWLHPYELAQFVVESASNARPGFHELEKYRAKPGFEPGKYYKDDCFTPRKVRELY
jgi:hypothetical protein